MSKYTKRRPWWPGAEYPTDPGTLLRLYRYFQRETSLLRRLAIEAEQREI